MYLMVNVLVVYISSNSEISVIMNLVICTLVVYISSNAEMDVIMCLMVKFCMLNYNFW